MKTFLNSAYIDVYHELKDIDNSNFVNTGVSCHAKKRTANGQTVNKNRKFEL